MGFLDILRPNIEKLQEKRDTKGLIRALIHKDLNTRSHAAYALGQLKAQEALEPLIHALMTDHDDVRREAAMALGLIQDPKAIPALIETFKYGLFVDAETRQITDAYRNTSQYYSPYGSMFVEARGNAKWALVEIGKPAVNPLITSLNDASPYSRASAAHVLGLICEKLAIKIEIEPICKLLDDKYFIVREAATAALGCIGDARALAPLNVVLKDSNSDVREAAKESLGKLS